MKLFLYFSFFIVCLARSPPSARRIDYRENNPEYKRFIFKQTGQTLELVDLSIGDINPRVSTSDVTYDFYTKTTKDSVITITDNNIGTLSGTNFDPSKPIVFVTHGWNNNRNSAVNTNIHQSIFVNYDCNLFIVDWSGPANEFYLTAKSATIPVGQIVAEFINSIQSTYGLSGSSFTLVGHSLGAHVAGIIGAAVNSQVSHIIGLDPAGPLYSLNETDDRLDETDAKFVQVIHTDGSLLGMLSALGDEDFYPNGGRSQPGCGLDLTGTCSHGRSYYYFAEALSRGNVFQAEPCTDYSTFQSGACGNNGHIAMGQLFPDSKNNGDYYLTTNSESPYGQS